MWSRRQLASEYRGGFRADSYSSESRQQTPSFLSRGPRLVDGNEVPAARKSHCAPWAEETTDRALTWSTEYDDQFTHYRVAMQQLQQAEELPVDSLLLPWDNSRPQAAGLDQVAGVADGTAVVREDDDDSLCGPHAESEQADVVGGPNDSIGTGQVSGRSVVIMDAEQKQGPPLDKRINLREELDVTGLIQAIKTADDREGGLDVNGQAARKSVLKAEPYTRRRGMGTPPAAAGAAPVGPMPSKIAAQTKPKRRHNGPPRPASARPAAREGDAGTWVPMTYSENWFEKRDNSFGTDLRAYLQRNKAGEEAKPRLPATPYKGVQIPVDGSMKATPAKSRAVQSHALSQPKGRKGPAVSGRPASARERDRSTSDDHLTPFTSRRPAHTPVSKRKALPPGKPQVASSANDGNSDGPKSYGRVEAVPGIAMYQASNGNHEFAAHQTSEVKVASANEHFGKGANAISVPVSYAGAGGGKPSDTVLAMTSPNLIGGPKSNRHTSAAPTERGGLRTPTTAGARLTGLAPNESTDSPGLHKRLTPAADSQDSAGGMAPAGLSSWDFPAVKASGIRRTEVSQAMLRSSVGDILQTAFTA